MNYMVGIFPTEASNKFTPWTPQIISVWMSAILRALVVMSFK